MDDEFEAARDDYESDIANKALEEDGVRYALEERTEEVERAVKQWQAEEWLEQSSDWLQLINIISQHDRQQLRDSIRYKAAYGGKSEESVASQELQLFNVASDVSKLLESNAKRPPILAQYAQYCNLDEDLNWVSDLARLTRAFRDILFAIADRERLSFLEWELVGQITTINAALEKSALPKLAYWGIGLKDKQHKFGRQPNTAVTPLSALLADWICDYLVNYSDRIDLGACVECGKVFPRQRRDNAYCSKTCQNRVAYKRKKIFESGLLQKLDVAPKTADTKLQPGVLMYHPRFGLGVVETVAIERLSLSVTARFPQVLRTFHLRDLFQSGPDSRIEFYTETDAVALAELL